MLGNGRGLGWGMGVDSDASALTRGSQDLSSLAVACHRDLLPLKQDCNSKFITALATAPKARS